MTVAEPLTVTEPLPLIRPEYVPEVDWVNSSVACEPLMSTPPVDGSEDVVDCRVPLVTFVPPE